MSDIIIKDMEMPTERESFNLTIKYNGTVLDTETGIQVAEAYELPPHGRMIDADALEYEEAYLNGHYELGDFEIVTREDIESAPTIISANEEKIK